MGEARILALGGDPVHERTAEQTATDPSLQAAYTAGQLADRYRDLRQAADMSGLPQLHEFFKGITEEYRELNRAPQAKLGPHSSPEELMLASLQSQPIQPDPNKVAEMRQLAAQIDQAIKQVDPRASFFEAPEDSGLYQLPEFKELARWINMEAGVGQAGFMTSGPQEMPFSATASQAAISGAEAGTDFALNLLYGGYNMGAEALNGMGVTDLPAPPTNYIRDPQTGELVANTARPHMGLTEAIVAMRNIGDRNAIAEELASLNDARRMEELQRSGAGDALVGTAQVVSMVGLPPIGRFGGWAGGFSPAIKAMELGTKGGSRLVTKGLGRLGVESDRMRKVLGFVGGMGGAAAANGTAMAVAYGRVDDYGTQFAHGAAIAPILLTLGALGKGTERLLRTRKNMPGSVKDKLNHILSGGAGGAVEGVGFGAMDDIQTRGLWEFLKDPTDANWGKYIGNMAGMGLVKMAGAAGAQQRRAFDEQAVVQESGKAVAAGIEGLKPEAMRAAGGDRGAVRKIVQDQASPGAKQAREIEGAAGESFAELAASRREASEAQLREEYRSLPTEERFARAAEAMGKAKKGKLTEAQLAAEEVRPARRRQANRQGVGSFQAGPERQVGALEGTKEITLGEVTDVMAGRRGRAGVKTPLGRAFGAKGDPVQVEIREGKTEGALGVAKKIGVIRSKEETDLVVLAHEWSHESMTVISRRRRQAGFGRQESFEQESRRFVESEEGLAEAEALLVGKDPTKPLYPGATEWFDVARGLTEGDVEFALYKIGSESWAEVGARKILGDAVRLEKEAPNLVEVHENMLYEVPGLYEQFVRTEAAHARWRGQGAAKRTELSASQTDKRMTKRREKRQGGKAAVKVREAKRQVYDDLAEGRAELERAEIAEGLEPGSTPLSADPMRQIDRTVGTAAATAEQFVNRGTIDASGRRTGDSLRDVFNQVQAQKITKTEFKNYLNSVRGLEDYKKGLSTTLAKEDYVATLRTLQEKAPALKRTARLLKGYAGRVLDFLVDSGGMSRADAAKFKDGRHVYVTLLRSILEQGGGRGETTGVAPRTAKGSSKELYDLPDAMVAMTNHYVRLGLRAQVHQSLLGAAKRGLGHVAELVPKGQQPNEVAIKDALKQMWEKANAEGNLEAMEQIEMLEQSGIEASTITLFTGKKWPSGSDKFIVPVVDRGSGKTEWVRVGEKTYDLVAGNHIKEIPQNVLAKSARGLAGWFRAAGVEYNPIFAAGAAVKDMMFRPSVTRGGAARSMRFLPGGGAAGHVIDLVLGGKDMFVDYVRRNGPDTLNKRLKAVGVRTAGDVDAQKEISRINKGWEESKGRLGKFVRVLKDIGRSATTWTEHAPRLQAAKSVYTKAKAGGMSERDAFQAAQETYREEMINFAKGGAMIRSLSGYVPFLKAGFLGQQKFVEAASSKEGVTAAFMNITVPAMLSYMFYKDEPWFQDLEDWEQRGYIHVTKDIRIPVPYELGYAFAAFPQLVADAAKDHPDYAPDQDEWAGLAAETFVPWLQDMRSAPPALRAFLEVRAEYDFFRDKPIVPQWLTEKRKPEEQVKLSTGETAKWAFGVVPDWLKSVADIDNPAEMGHLGQAFLPGIAPHVVESFEAGDPLRSIDITQRFRSDTGHQSKSQRLMNERVTFLTQRKDELDGPQRRELARLRKAKRKISKLWDDEDLTPADRSDQIREIAMDALSRERK